MTDRNAHAAALLATPVDRRGFAAVAIGAGLAIATSVRGVDAGRRTRRGRVTTATTSTGTSATGTDSTVVVTGETNTGTSQTNGNVTGDSVVRTVTGEVVTGTDGTNG